MLKVGHRQHRLNPLHHIQAVDEIVDIVEIVRLEHQNIAHVIGIDPVVVQAFESFQISEWDVLLHLAATQFDALAQSPHGTTQIDHQVRWLDRIENSAVKTLVGSPVAF